ncbi:unnamed protein product [Rotaria socialis]
MSSKVKTTTKGEAAKTKKQSSKKIENNITKQIRLSKSDVNSSSLSHSSTSHQQHHSAPPSQSQQPKTGLQSINENVEYLATNVTSEQQQQQQQQNSTNSSFPRSNTVPYPAYATFRKGGGNSLPSHYYYTDYPTFFHGTVSPAPATIYYNTRQPLSSINTDFQPISPHHQQYVNRPVDVLKPTFLIVSKEAEQQLTTQLSTSPIPITNTATKQSSKPMSKKTDTIIQAMPASTAEQSSPTVRNIEVQTTNQSPTTTTTAAAATGAKIMDNTHQHVGIINTPNPSPYVHFLNVSYPIQSSQFLQGGPPETSIMNDEFIQINDYHQPSTSIRSMPNIALAQVSPHHIYGSSNVRHYHVSQHTPDEQQQQTSLTNTESTVVRSATVPPMATTSKNTRMETGETDELSVASLDFTHTEFVDIPGSWRHRLLPDGTSVPVTTAAKRYRAPIPRAFLDSQQYHSDCEQVVRSSSFRHPQQQQQSLVQSRTFGSIPTINRPFDSIRSQQPFQIGPIIRLNERDVLKVASFYQSIGTLVYVARSIATLYTSDFDAMANLKDWKKLYTGVPIWLFNTGMNPKRARCIRLIISELGSSFTLWDTIVNGASDVRLPKARHVTLKSLETGTILALKFDDTSATDEFHQYFVKLSCDPRNADLFDIFNAKRRQPVFLLRKRKIKKSAISKPTEFNHITKVDEHDRDSLYTYSVLVDDGAVVDTAPEKPNKLYYRKFSCMLCIFVILFESINFSIANDPILIASPYPFNTSKSSDLECFSNDQGIIQSLTIIAPMLDIGKNTPLLLSSKENVKNNASITLKIPTPFNYSKLNSKIECRSKYHHGQQQASQLKVLSVAEIIQKESFTINTYAKQMVAIDCLAYGTNVIAIHWDFIKDISKRFYDPLPVGIRFRHKFTLNDTLIIDHVSYSDHHGYYRCSATNKLLNRTYEDKSVIYLNVQKTASWIPIVIVCAVIGIFILTFILCAQYFRKKRKKQQVEKKQISQNDEKMVGPIEHLLTNQVSIEDTSYYNHQISSEQMAKDVGNLKLQQDDFDHLSHSEHPTELPISKSPYKKEQERTAVFYLKSTSKISPQFILGNPFIDANAQSLNSVKLYVNKFCKT